jgi:hypothetical protein
MSKVIEIKLFVVVFFENLNKTLVTYKRSNIEAINFLPCQNRSIVVINNKKRSVVPKIIKGIWSAFFKIVDLSLNVSLSAAMSYNGWQLELVRLRALSTEY